MANKISPNSIKLRFSTDDFVRGINDFEDRMADSFYTYLKEQFKNQQVSFSAIEKRYAKDDNDTLDLDELSKSIRKKDQLVFIKDGRSIGELTYSDVFKILDRGQHDLGILPQPILKTAFDNFRPIYKTALKNFLLGKK